MTWIYGTATPTPHLRRPTPIYLAPLRGAVGLSLRIHNTIYYLGWVRCGASGSS